MAMTRRWLTAPLLGTAVAVVALRRGALAPSGAAGAAVVGTTIFGASGTRGAALLLLFFGSSSALSRLSDGEHATLNESPRGQHETMGQTHRPGTAGFQPVPGEHVVTGSAGFQPAPDPTPGRAGRPSAQDSGTPTRSQDDGGPAGSRRSQGDDGGPAGSRRSQGDDGGPAGSRRSQGHDRAAGGPRRTLVQVLANGGLPALLAAANAARPSRRLSAAYAGALAAANADTWATEIGALSASPPRVITTGRVARPGDSGAITPLGLLASGAGALLIACADAAVERRPASVLPLAAAGIGGALADSVLGATVQAVYVCRDCAARTEDRTHAHGGAPPHLTLTRGLPFMTNDMVNICASLIGAIGGAILAGRHGSI